jgi:hypothetical protein
VREKKSESGRNPVVTKRKKRAPRAPGAVKVKKQRPLMGRMRGTAEVVGDIVYFDTSDEWECNR